MLMIVPTFVNAQEANIPRLEAQIVRDEIFKTAPVSGEWLVGVHWKGPQAPRRPSLFAFIPSNLAGKKLCTSGVSISGLFETIFEYSVPNNWSASLAALSFPTKYVERAKILDINSSGVTVQIGSCNNPKPIFIANYWNSRFDKSKDTILVLNLNSENSDEVFVYFGDDAERPVKCSRVANLNKIAFDFQCFILVDRNLPSEVKIEVQRFRNGSEKTPRIATLIFADRQ